MAQRRLKIGLFEEVKFEGGIGYLAKIDTGADSSSIDLKIAERLSKIVVSHKYVRSALGRDRRAVVILEIEFQKKKFLESFTVSDRSNLKYKVLIGKDILKKEGFLIDPLKVRK